jgi:hypothetical protein
MARLYVIGDSFVAPPKPNDPTAVWPMMVAEQMGLELINPSEMGTAQDWCWQKLQTWLDSEISEDDYVIVALTHPSRFWFFEEQPRLSHPYVIDLDRWCSREQSKAIEHYIRYIQRPSLDIVHVNNRLSYIAYQVLKKGLKRPLMIKCFDQDVAQGEHFSELNWAKGILMDDTQAIEFDPRDLDKHDQSFWPGGIDARYNHLCLTNHKIMADKVVAALTNDSQLDLTTGFVAGLLKENTLDDLEFCARELCAEVCEYNRKIKAQGRKTVMPWSKRVNLI